MTCRVLKLSGRLCFRWLADPVTDVELVEALRADALFEAHGRHNAKLKLLNSVLPGSP